MLQIVVKSDIRQCACEEAESQRGWTRGGVPIKTPGPIGVDLGVPQKRTSASEVLVGTLAPKKVDCEILHLYKGVEISP